MSIRTALAVSLGFAAMSCQGPARYDSPSTQLQRGISFVESDEASRLHPISAKDPDERSVSRVPQGWPVDPNSRIKLRILRDQLAGVSRDSAWGSVIDELAATWSTLAPIVEDLETYVELAPLVHAAYLESQAIAAQERDSSVQHRDFIDKRRDLADVEDRILTALQDVEWTDAEEDLIEDSGDNFAGLLLRFQAALERQRALTNEVRYKLRLEAFLLGAGTESEPLHLPGFDSFVEGRLQPLDRWGLRLEGQDLERFKEMNAEAKRIADAGNRYLDGKIDAEEAFRSLADGTLAPVFTLAADVTALSREFEADQLVQRRDRSQEALTTLEGELQDAVTQLAEEARGEFKSSVEDLELQLRSELAGKLELALLLADLGQIRAQIKNFQFSAVPEIAGLASEIADRLGRIAEASGAFVEDAETRTREALAALVAGLDQSAGERVTSIWQASAARLELDGWIALARRAQDVGQRGMAVITNLKGSGALPNAPGDLPLPEVIDVALIDAHDTSIELRRSGRRPGDTLRVRARMINGENEGTPYVQDFSIKWLGWHARLDPSVILAKPDKGLEGEANFRFSTAVSWLWSYEPRPDEDKWQHQVLRFTDLAVGPHTVLLPFNPDKDVEIGLGLTVSLWNGVLQGGVGSNLMEGGDLYYFVGSSLIALVQAVGNELPRSSSNSVTPQD